MEGHARVIRVTLKERKFWNESKGQWPLQKSPLTHMRARAHTHTHTHTHTHLRNKHNQSAVKNVEDRRQEDERMQLVQSLGIYKRYLRKKRVSST